MVPALAGCFLAVDAFASCRPKRGHRTATEGAGCCCVLIFSTPLFSYRACQAKKPQRHKVLLDCVTVAVLPGVPSCTTTVVALF
jgi:hypothetical protein